ncbi:hypothetical protein BKA93DRAFT_799245 [Sparassis latifolia]
MHSIKVEIAAQSRGLAQGFVCGPSIINDDDVLGWDNDREDVGEDDVTEPVVASDRGFEKRQRTDTDSGWATVREGERG